MEINTEYTTHGTARNTGYPALFPACFFLGKYRTYLYLQTMLSTYTTVWYLPTHT